MEERDIFSSGHAVKVNEVPQNFNVAQNSVQFSGPTLESPVPVPDPASVPAATVGSTEAKKKRGRPRKSESDRRVPLSPMPISSSIPLTGNFSGWKRGSGKPVESIKKSSKFLDFEGDGSNFQIHVLTVNSGEDVTMKIMSFSQQGFHAVCILSANGTISNVTLRESTSWGGTSTYEGIFEILTLKGSFIPSENGPTKSRTGGLSVQLAGPDGRVMGGGLAGLLVAAGPVRVVVGSFLPQGHHQPEQKVKKQKVEHMSITAPTALVNPVSAEEMKTSLGGIKPIMTSAGFRVDHIPSFNNGHGHGHGHGHGSRNLSAADNEAPEKESNPSHSDAGAAC